MPRKPAGRKGTKRKYAKAPRSRAIIYKSPSHGFPGGMPKVRRATMRYCQTVVLASQPTGTLQSYVFSCNNLNDPDLTATGHRPLGYNQWLPLYDHYVVTSSKMTAKAYVAKEALTTAAYRPTTIGMYVADDTSIPFVDITPVVEANRGTVRTLNHNQTYSAVSASYDAKKFFNITDIKDNLKRLGAAMGSYPDEQAYFVFYYAPLVGGQTTHELHVMFTLEYTVEFSEPKDLAQS